MARVIIYNTTDFSVKEYYPSANTSDYDKRLDSLINPTFVVNELTVPMKYWKVSSDAIVEMTQAEKDQVEAALIQTKLANDRIAASRLEFALQDVIAALVKRVNIRLINLIQPAITKQEIIDQLKQDKGL